MEGVDGSKDEVLVDFVFHSGLSVTSLPSCDHGNDCHAVSVDGEGDGGVRELECCCHGSQLCPGVGERATYFVVVGALGGRGWDVVLGVYGYDASACNFDVLELAFAAICPDVGAGLVSVWSGHCVVAVDQVAQACGGVELDRGEVCVLGE
eukprot:3252750-Rhodomonas_salina.1